MNHRPTTYKDAALTGLSYAPISPALQQFYAPLGNPMNGNLMPRCGLPKIEGNPGGEPKPRVVFPLKMFSLRRLDIFDFVSQVPHVQCIQPALPRYHRLWYGGIRTPDWACLQEGEPEACVLFLTQFQTCILFMIPTSRFLFPESLAGG